jgi:hypothetical protein
MMPQSFLYPVNALPTVNFLEALGAAAGFNTPPFVGTAMNNIPGVPAIASRRFLIRAIEYLCVQQVGLEFDFFNSATGLTNVIGTDGFISRFQFATVQGQQFNSVALGGGLFRFYIDGLAIPYVDLDTINTVNPPTLHVAAQNVDTVAKSAGAGGAVNATFWLEPMQSY